jgi:hypothetical protein
MLHVINHIRLQEQGSVIRKKGEKVQDFKFIDPGPGNSERGAGREGSGFGFQGMTFIVRQTGLRMAVFECGG